MAARRLPVRYSSCRALLASARTERSVLSLFVPGAEHVAAGADVLLEVSVDRSTLRFELEGRVRLQFQETDSRGPGLGVVFHGTQKRAAGLMLATCAAASGDGTAIDARQEVEVSCLINLHGKKLRGTLKDVSSTGAFVGTPLVPGLRGEAELSLHLEPVFGLWGGPVLKAKVIWVGEKHGVYGFGARFLDDGASVRERLKKHLPLAP